MSTSPAAAAALYAQPSDVTLLNEILRPWVTSGDTKAYVHAADLYSADPEELARRFPPAVSMDGDRTWYFLSPLRNKSPRDRRKVRAVADGAGCWHSEAAPRNVLDHLHGGRHVGYRQSFSFMRRDAAAAGGADARSGWIMAEFHLHSDHDAHGGRAGGKVEGLVLCKMYRSPRHHGPAAPAAADDDVAFAVSLSTETTSFSCVKQSRAINGDEDDSNAVTPRWHRHAENTDGAAMATATAMAAASPPEKEKAVAGDDEVSGATTAMAPWAKNDAVAADEEDCLVVSPPACKKRRVDVAHAAESSGAPAAEAQLHCPQCGFHLAALQALVTLTKTTSESALPLGDIADSQILSRRQRNGTRIIS